MTPRDAVGRSAQIRVTTRGGGARGAAAGTRTRTIVVLGSRWSPGGDIIAYALIADRLREALDLTDALAAGLSAEALGLHNGKAPSNAIGGQLWCLVGARESYARAFEVGAWQGFACSLHDTRSPSAVQGALAASRGRLEALLTLAASPLDPAREAALFSLLEHEAQHHGQLIRYFYANDLAFPPAFAARYALKQP